MRIKLSILFISLQIFAFSAKANYAPKLSISLSDFKSESTPELFRICNPKVIKQNNKSFGLQIRNKKEIDKRKLLIISNSVFYGGTYLGFYYLWYKNYDLRSFHFFDDSKEWLQVDKTGHIYSSYYLTKLQSEAIEWTGAKKNNALKYGTLTAFIYVSSIEILDGFSKDWGASLSDMSANLFGIGLYAFQEISFQKQYVVPKFSYNFDSHINLRPELLGSNFYEQILKDYNGQTYWLSSNISDITGMQFVPQWLNIAIGYGGKNMLGGHENPIEFQNYKRTRQYYLSLDLDLKNINTKKKWLNFIIHHLDFVKIPLPTIEYSSGNWRFYPVYF